MLKHNSLEQDNALWRFALDTWQTPAIQQVLLDLQDRHEARINLVLAALWLAHNQCCAPQAIESAALKTQAWHNTYVIGLRRLRKGLAKGLPLREQLAEAELSAEHLELAELYRLLAPTAFASAPQQAANSAIVNLKAVLPECVMRLEEAALETLIQSTLSSQKLVGIREETVKELK